jgi:hypothetical protein
MTDSFFKWLDNVERTAKDTEVGKLATQAGYSIAHTGGGCLCWEIAFPNGHYVWICDEGNGLGDKVDEPYFVGYYNEDADILADGTMPDLRAALAWCDVHVKAERALPDPDKVTIAEAFASMATAAHQINDVLARRDDLNDNVPTNWPLNLSADEFAAECQAMVEHYKGS